MSAGNKQDQSLTDKTPRRLTGADTPHIVVGAAMADGNRWTDSDGFGSTWRDPTGNDILSVYAVCHEISMAGHEYDYQYVVRSGTSGAAAQVAGMAAFYMATLGKNALQIKDYLIAEALALKGGTWAHRRPPFRHTPARGPPSEHGALQSYRSRTRSYGRHTHDAPNPRADLFNRRHRRTLSHGHEAGPR